MYSYYCYACMEWYFKPSHQLKAKTIVHMCGSILGAPWVGEVWITWGAGWCLTHFLPWRGRGATTGALRPAPLTGWVRVELVLWNPFVVQFGRGTSSPAYKYKGHGRLRSFYPIESINLLFSYFSPNPSFSNLVLLFARLDGVQRRFGWHADHKTTLDLRALTGSLPSLRF